MLESDRVVDSEEFSIGDVGEGMFGMDSFSQLKIGFSIQIFCLHEAFIALQTGLEYQAVTWNDFVLLYLYHISCS